ncbi:hypothetical protein [Streptomyces sp. enrichment culture]|uniref:hypothetical protein n=1 Tax=Streptomyces sp. enrichment culture TaxID=1795815 RepID=UPI003F5517A9
MEQATQPTTTTPTEPVEQDPDRAAYKRARALAERLIDQVQELPLTVQTTRSLAPVYDVHIYFGAGLAAGRGVQQTAAVIDTEPTRDAVRNSDDKITGYWIEARATVRGVPVYSYALTSPADAELLLPSADTAPGEEPAEAPGEVTQPMPTVSADPATAVVPQITPVLPLSAMKTAVVDQDDEARCVKCGCTEDTACKGGCYWVPNEQQVDLCSACATPQQLAAMVFAPVTETRA